MLLFLSSLFVTIYIWGQMPNILQVTPQTLYNMKYPVSHTEDQDKWKKILFGIPNILLGWHE